MPDLVEMGVDILNVQRECNDWVSLMSSYRGRWRCGGGVSARTLDLGAPFDFEREASGWLSWGAAGESS